MNFKTMLDKKSLSICVFCSSSDAVDDIYANEAHYLGTLMALSGHKLVYGGTNVGLMRVVASAMKSAGGSVTGVIPESIFHHGRAFGAADELIVTKDLRERKATMEQRSDAFVALPGGIGTLEEALEIMTLRQLQLHEKPLVFLNTAGYFEPLFSLLRTMAMQRFMKPDYTKLYCVATNAYDAILAIETFSPDVLASKWFDTE